MPTAVDRLLAELAAGAELYIGRDPGSPDMGSGFASRTIRAARTRGLIAADAYVPLRGRRLRLTDDGRAAVPGRTGGE